jgi:SpoVK/Ycf46/Vps4 family AAA+-type ATPase
VLLFGPPGTTKTTIVRAVAEGLDWPLITLGPGDFVQEGLERVEARADLIFSELHSLSRTVVLFDECDELFRERKPSQGNDQVRGIAAFVTASMLPKLQELHDRGQIVLFILTNHFATMDPAIKRLGRVDHIIGVGPPDAAQRTVILQKAFDDELSKEDKVPAKIVEAVIEAIAYADPHFIRSELLRIASQVAGSLRDAEKLTVAIARELAHEIVEKQATPTVNDDQYKEFEQQRLEASLHA